MMLTTPSSQMLETQSASTISHIVLKPPRACVIHSQGDGFGSYIERLINVAHETHQAFPHLIGTLQDLINYIRNELEQTYSQYQFSIIAGKSFDHEQISSHHLALIEHAGMKLLIFSSTGCSYKFIATTTDEIDDSSKALAW